MSHGDQKLFSNASFTINSKERCGLVGRNGSGKTTLLRLIIGQEHIDKGSITIPKGYHLGYLDQHIRFSKQTVLEEACLGLSEEDRDSTYKAERILFGLGFQKISLDTSPGLLSGGFHLRLHLTKVLLSEPDCLLLDEPTNYLDIVSLRFLTRFLQRWQGELLIVSHDREFMDSITTHTIGIHRNKIRKVRGGTADLFAPILTEEETYEKTREKLDARRSHMQNFIDRLGAKSTKAAQAQSRKKQLTLIPALEALTAIDNLDFCFHESPFQGKKLGEVRNLSFSYEEPLINDLSFVIGKKERIAIIGKNGYGKSTILRLLAKDLSPDAGTISYADQVSIGYFGQTNILRLNEKATIEEEVFSANTSLSTTEVRSLCGQMMFSGTQADKRIGVLSGGERSRVLLGKIIAKPCNLLLLDEPTHHLDIESVEALIDAINVFSGTVIIVTHSELILNRIDLNRLIVCSEGAQTVYEGGYDEFLEKGGWQDEAPQEPPKERRSDRGEEKRRRAELVAARSKALRPLKEEMDRLEAAVIALEEAQAIDQSSLESLPVGSTPPPALLITIGKRAKEIETSFNKLMALGDQCEAIRQEFSTDS